MVSGVLRQQIIPPTLVKLRNKNALPLDPFLAGSPPHKTFTLLVISRSFSQQCKISQIVVLAEAVGFSRNGQAASPVGTFWPDSQRFKALPLASGYPRIPFAHTT